MTDPSKPVRKRRRPAFSCTECRRRKVRCDRAVPCLQCTAYNNASGCTYEEGHRSLPVRAASSTLRSRQQEDRTQSSPNAPRHPDVSPRTSTPAAPGGRLQGTISKTRVFGYGHWMTASSMGEEFSIFEPIGEYYKNVFQHADHSPTDEVTKIVVECKQLARDIKKQRPSRRRLAVDIHLSFLDRQVMDELVALYFNTFESCHRIVYRPSFMAEYKNYVDSQGSSENPFLLQLALVITVAGALHGDSNVRGEIAAKAPTWIHISQTWLSAPLEKDRLTLKCIQVQCLLLLCRQIYHVGADLVWISVGSLMRMAMHMGLHQDPNKLGEMSVLEKEIRRRLWYTILEMNVQAALDSGGPPMILDGDYNTQPPSNISDEDLEHVVREEELSNNPSRMSLQSLLAKSLPLRLRVTRIINSLQEEPSYNQILNISNELASACREVTTVLDQAASTSNSHPTAKFAQSYCNHLLRRFPLCLHFRYAIKAKSDPLFSHSQKVGLEAALDLVSLLEDDLYRRLLLVGGGMFRDIITRGVLLIFLELSPDPETETSNFAKKRNRARQDPLLRDAHRVVQYSEDRIRHGDTNVKVYVVLHMLMVQAQGRFDGSLTDDNITKALHDGLYTCHQILKDMVTDINNQNSNNSTYSDIDFESWTSNDMNMTAQADFGMNTFNNVDDANINFDFLDYQLPSQWADQTWS
ncbi:fungal-specific transcription factor domain-containing protein [Talaromyces proteolyticus]|uniref:Fungal-specific transcription factor domain-containing protein n=1 Tax=Talaromyces proteolyticus TaxID=1131652 RepID=A0AAD4KT85_9EURO|nr:fungal-specific transcription factor domain-containing protein [Talaromyces proteolyticus]KAH8700482.1 fungal-specific transcription factor domain-containing protein [Talaromyces proteolyticus]